MSIPDPPESWVRDGNIQSQHVASSMNQGFQNQDPTEDQEKGVQDRTV